jgi:hypothetical protein
VWAKEGIAMIRLSIPSVLFCGALLAPFAAAQTVSLAVRTPDAVVGAVGEKFDCIPHKIDADVGSLVDLLVFGKRATFFAAFVGLPTTACTPIGGLDGALVLGAPVITLGLGGIYDWEYDPDYPETGLGEMSYLVPSLAPLGVSLRLQAVSFAADDVGLAFSRGVEIRTR